MKTLAIPVTYVTQRAELGAARADVLDIAQGECPKRLAEPPVDFASLYVTGRCHLSCPHCYAEEDFANVDGDVSTETLIRVVNGLCALTNRIQLTGGEVFARRDPRSGRNDTLLIVDEISRRDRTTILQTTGMHLTPAMLDFLVGRGVEWLSMSLDGPDADWNSRLRGTDAAFTKVVTIIPEIKKRGFKIKVGTTVTALNADLEKMRALGRLLASLEVDNWKLYQFFPRQVGRTSATNSEMLSVSDEEYAALFDALVAEFGDAFGRLTRHGTSIFANAPALLVQPSGVATVLQGTTDVVVGDVLRDDPQSIIRNIAGLGGLKFIAVNGSRTY